MSYFISTKGKSKKEVETEVNNFFYILENFSLVKESLLLTLENPYGGVVMCNIQYSNFEKKRSDILKIVDDFYKR